MGQIRRKLILLSLIYLIILGLSLKKGVCKEIGNVSFKNVLFHSLLSVRAFRTGKF